MARILNVEKPEYINKNIDIFIKNRVSQYSKFLEKTPTYITYYHMNLPMSRQDVGTGNVEMEIGPHSPIRFNKIINFPVYNLPEMKPDINYDETGYDVELDCSDVTVLPNTIKPRAGDYFIVSLLNTKEYLFRVTGFKYNTIQSNDFYTLDCDIRDIGDTLEAKWLKTQIVETYLTVFENIGTEDKCFIKSTDVNYINSLATLYGDLKDYYYKAFYNRDLNSFTYQTGRYSEFGNPLYRYDAYLEKFIMDSRIFYDDTTEESLALTPNDVLDDQFLFKYDMTLYRAILRRDKSLLRKYCYIVSSFLTYRYSIYNMMGYNAESVDLFLYKKPLNENNDIDTSNDNTCTCCQVIAPSDGSEKWYDVNPTPKCTPTWSLSNGIEYFPSEFLSSLWDNEIDTNDYYQYLIFNFINNIKTEINKDFIFEELDRDERNFYYLPMIIFIINTLYNDYFTTENDGDLFSI